MPEPMYTIAQIKEAFWKEFHKAGDLWFDYLGDDEECEADTMSAWRDFREHLTGKWEDEDGKEIHRDSESGQLPEQSEG